MKSLGFVEVSGTVAALDALDIMCKSAGVSLVTWERKLGGRLVTIIVEGSVSDVTEAVENAKKKCLSEVCASNVIANPHSETARMVEKSAARLAKKDATEQAEAKAPAEKKSAQTSNKRAKKSTKSEK